MSLAAVVWLPPLAMRLASSDLRMEIGTSPRRLDRYAHFTKHDNFYLRLLAVQLVDLKALVALGIAAVAGKRWRSEIRLVL